MRLCIDCRWHFFHKGSGLKDFDAHLCKSPETQRASPVTGKAEPVPGVPSDCKRLRDNAEHCGQVGKWWQA